MWSLATRLLGRPASPSAAPAPEIPESPSDPGTGSAVLLEHYRDQLTQERNAKQALEQRGLGIVAADAAVVSLLVAFGDVTPDTSTPLGVAVAVVTFTAMAAFATSAYYGLRVNEPGEYAGSSVAGMATVANHRKSWARRDKNEAERFVALDIARLIGKDRAANSAKGKRLRTAVRWQVIGVIVLAVAVVLSSFAPPSAEEDTVPKPPDEQHQSEAVEPEEPSEPIDLGEPDLVLRQQEPSRDSRDWWKAIQQQREQGDRDTNPH